ncbi:hypothetical protein DYGSA30_33720 [Dyella sp. GSA-30]|nr:hypothetical protein DYGSA30_33720 [Dyella sp. GSA-30]
MSVTVSMDAIQAELAASRPMYLRDLSRLVGAIDTGATISKTTDAALSFGGYRTTTYGYVGLDAAFSRIVVEIIDDTQAVIRLALFLKPSADPRVDQLVSRYELSKLPHYGGHDGFEQYARSYPGGNLDVYVPLAPEAHMGCATEIHVFADPRISSPSAYHVPR